MLKDLRASAFASGGDAGVWQSAGGLDGLTDEVSPGDSLIRRLTRAFHMFWRDPESRLLQAGGEGELTLARIRVLILAGLLLFALSAQLKFPDQAMVKGGLGLAAAATVIGIATLIGVRRSLYRPWIGFFTSLLDVSMVSVALALFLLIGDPLAAMNSAVVFPLYFLAIAATSVRLDHRVCAFTGLVAFAQYLVIVIIAAAALQAAARPPGAPPADSLRWSVQVGRLALLGCAGLISTVVILGAQRLRQLSATDPLTGLMNRRAFDERLVEELARARRYGRPISIAMIDIDYFKQFNDTYGHVCGDDALRSVAATLRSRLRTGDVVARYGGEEFVVLLPETAAHTAVATAELLRRAVAASPLSLNGYRDPIPVTVSIGVASWPEHGTEISRLQERADDRLYQAKLAGRDQVVGPAAKSLRV
ncbi:MAG: GGDEF domain-containing protein [Gemmatimonadota bacterium]